MISYLFKRLILMFPTLLGIMTVNFIIIQFAPGGPLEQAEAEMMEAYLENGESGSDVSSEMGGALSELDRRRLKRMFGLDKPLWERYLRMLLWFSPREIAYLEDIPPGSSYAFKVRGKTAVILHASNSVKAFYDSCSAAVPSHIALKDNLIICQEHGHRYDLEGHSLSSHLDSLKKLPLKFSSAAGTPIMLDEKWTSQIFDGDNWHGYFIFKFGHSFYQQKGVLELIADKLPVSMRLGIISFFLSYLVCIPLGIFKAIRSGSAFDTASSALILIGHAVPGFVLAVLFLVFLGPGENAFWHLIPLSGIDSSGTPGYVDWSFWMKLKDWIWHLIGPITCLAIGSFANLTILTKNSMLEELKELYATTARAKGCPEKSVILKHVFKNASLPLITGFPGAFLSMFFAGALLIESIFSLDGMGLLSFNAILRRDYPLMLGTLYIFTLLGMLGHLLRDISYAWVDPRITYK
jgi:microcin C transport system permease protein